MYHNPSSASIWNLQKPEQFHTHFFRTLVPRLISWEWAVGTWLAAALTRNNLHIKWNSKLKWKWRLHCNKNFQDAQVHNYQSYLWHLHNWICRFELLPWLEKTCTSSWSLSCFTFSQRAQLQNCYFLNSKWIRWVYRSKQQSQAA